MKQEKTKIEKKKTTKKKKKSNINIKVVIAIIVLVVITAYAIYSALLLLRQPTDVFMIEEGKVSDEVEATGYIIREETVVQGQNYKNGMVQIKGEGQRAAKDEAIFRYYSNGEEDLVKKIKDLDDKIGEAIDKDQGSLFSSDIKVLDKEIELKLGEIVKNNSVQKIQEYKKDIQTSITKKAKIAGDLSPSGSYLKKLIEERSSYENKLNSGSEYIKAPVSGTVSYKVDGLESVLTTDNFSSLSKEKLDGFNLKTGQVIANSSQSGKLVNNYKCYITTNLSSDKLKNIILDKKQLRDATIGDKLTLRLSNAEEIVAKIEYIADDTNNTKLVVFSIEKGVQELINYRKISFDVIFWNYTGLKVPNSSIIEEDNLSYVVRNRAGYLDKILVKVIKKNETYSIIGTYSISELNELGYSASDIKSNKSISLYDEILTKPRVEKKAETK